MPVGKRFTMDVFVAQARSMTGDTVKVAFDPRVVEFREAVPGELVGAGRRQAAVTHRPSDGEMELRFDSSPGFLKNEGRFMSLTFIAKAPGVSPVRVTVPAQSGEGESDELASGKGIVRVR